MVLDPREDPYKIWAHSDDFSFFSNFPPVRWDFLICTQIYSIQSKSGYRSEKLTLQGENLRKMKNHVEPRSQCPCERAFPKATGHFPYLVHRTSKPNLDDNSSPKALFPICGGGRNWGFEQKCVKQKSSSHVQVCMLRMFRIETSMLFVTRIETQALCHLHRHETQRTTRESVVPTAGTAVCQRAWYVPTV